MTKVPTLTDHHLAVLNSIGTSMSAADAAKLIQHLQDQGYLISHYDHLENNSPTYGVSKAVWRELRAARATPVKVY
jgi:hypothetical protein